ncbi:Uncharacterized protein SCF082_LOCUS28920, partial [Durusdinium trenchii]
SSTFACRRLMAQAEKHVSTHRFQHLLSPFRSEMASFSSAKARASSLKSEGMELIMATKARAVKIVEQTTVKIASVQSRLTETAMLRGERLLTSAKSLKATAAQSLSDVKTATRSSYSQLRQVGLRSWVGDHLQLVRGYMAAGISNWQEKAMKSYQASKARSLAFLASTRKALLDRVQQAKDATKLQMAAKRSQALKTVEHAKAKAVEAKDKAAAFARDDHVRATALGVAGGMTTLGTTGAATGLCAGTAVGAALGVVPALFTFGLSIPLGAALGGGAGLFMGTAVGATAGAVSGGAAGYGAYAKRGEIQELRSKTISRISSGVDVVKGKATASAEFLKDKASAARARMVGVSSA